MNNTKKLEKELQLAHDRILRCCKSYGIAVSVTLALVASAHETIHSDRPVPAILQLNNSSQELIEWLQSKFGDHVDIQSLAAEIHDIVNSTSEETLAMTLQSFCDYLFQTKIDVPADLVHVKVVQDRDGIKVVRAFVQDLDHL